MWERRVAGRGAQLAAAGALTAAVGVCLQLLKLAALDGAGRELGAPSYAARAAFLAPFGLAKALGNGLAGVLADRPGVGRARTAAVGWVLGLPAPLVLLVLSGAPDELPWAVTANAFLGAQQGMAWSSLLLVFMDLLPARAGLAAGACEAVGYLAIAASAGLYSSLERLGVACSWAAGSVAGSGCRTSLPDPPLCARPDDWQPACAAECHCGPYVSRGSPFAQVSLGLMLAALAASLCFLRDSSPLRRGGRGGEAGGLELEAFGGENAVRGGGALADEEQGGEEVGLLTSEKALAEAAGAAGSGGGRAQGDGTPQVGAREKFLWTTWRNKSTALVCASGFAVNLTTGVAWGLLLAWARDSLGLSGGQRDFVAASYSLVKGLSQLVTGPLSDWGGRRRPLALGFVINAGGLLVSALAPQVAGGSSSAARFQCLVLGSVILGLGTGLVYPALAAAIGDHAAPEARGTCVGTFRFWRDLGYTAGALVALLADGTSPAAALGVVAAVSTGLAVAIFLLYHEGEGEREGGGGFRGDSTSGASFSRPVA